MIYITYKHMLALYPEIVDHKILVASAAASLGQGFINPDQRKHWLSLPAPCSVLSCEHLLVLCTPDLAGFSSSFGLVSPSIF